MQAGDEEVGVMMGWETEIMKQTVEKLCMDHDDLHEGLHILNIGFGLGIIDGFFTALPQPPALHVIIEAHPDVLAHMREKGWYDKPNVKILEGKWQDFIASGSLLESGGFDVIYSDTFSESYSELQQFFQQVPDLMRSSSSRFGFFNGLGATNALFYDVYRHVVDLHLAEEGLHVEWFDVDIGEDVDRWNGTREYFSMRLYRMPIVKWQAHS